MFRFRNLFYFFLFNIFFSSYSIASEFKYVGTSRAGDDYFLGVDSIKKKNGKFYAWHLTNYNPPRNNYVGSELTKLEYNCEDDSVVFLSIFAHAKKNGEGKVLAKDANIPKGKVYLPPNSQFERMHSFICK